MRDAFRPGTRLSTDDETRTFVRVEGARVIYHTTYSRHAVPVDDWVAWCDEARVMFRAGPAPSLTAGQRAMGIVAFDALAQEAEHELGRAWWVRRLDRKGWRVTLSIGGDRLVFDWTEEPYYRDVAAWFAAASAAETLLLED